MSAGLRVAGWILFASGAGYCGYLVSQGPINWKDPLTVVAAIAMPVGMGCTTLATVIRLLHQRLKGPQMAAPEPEPAPDPNKPVKVYKVRPLEKEKIKTEEKKEEGATGPPAAPPG